MHGKLSDPLSVIVTVGKQHRFSSKGGPPRGTDGGHKLLEGMFRLELLLDRRLIFKKLFAVRASVEDMTC